MNPEEAEKAIRRQVEVTPQMVIVAKAIALDAATAKCTAKSLFDAVLTKNGVTAETPRVIVHESVDTDASTKAVAQWLSWRLAAAEAIWSLIHGGLLFVLDDRSAQAPRIHWTTAVPSSTSSTASSWDFEDCWLTVPGGLKSAPSASNTANQFLSEPDLYLNSLGVVNMHADVGGAFHEAVKCFRNEFFTASLAMLGKASEGAWLELGASLLRIVPKSDEAKYSKQRKVLEDLMIGTFKKIDAVLTIYDHQETFGAVSKASGIRLQELRSVAVWSDAVRDSRNTIHFGVTPMVPNTYEKLAALLIGAVPYVRMLYRVKQAADAVVVP